MLFHEDSKTISLGKYGSARNIITRVFYFPFFFHGKEHRPSTIYESYDTDHDLIFVVFYFPDKSS